MLLIFSLNSVVLAAPINSSDTKAANKWCSAQNNNIINVIIQNPDTDPNIVVQNYFKNCKNKKSTLPPAIYDISLKRTVNVRDGLTLRFYPDGSFVVDQLTSETVTKKVADTKAAKKYKKGKNDQNRYNAAGTIIYSIHVTAMFGYDGKKAWYDSGFDAYYKKGFLCIWQVSNWTEGTELVQGGAKCTAYGRGNFHWGVEYQNIGCTFQDNYENLRVSCSKTGAITKAGN